MYVYVSIYICGPISRSRARNHLSPGFVRSAKSDFSWCPVSGAFSGCFRRLQRGVLGSLSEGSATSFFWSQIRILSGMRKSPPFKCFVERRQDVLYCKNMQTVQYILQKSKVCFRWYKVSNMCHFCSQKLVLEVPNSTQHVCFLAHNMKSLF